MNEITRRIFNFFLQHYEPAQDPAGSDEQMTTNEIKEKIDEFYGESDCTITELFEALEGAGFGYTIINNEFRWLLKEKTGE